MPYPRYICIHGHFYQPPRENPWLESIELQDSAEPFHDWNERITAECYAPNSAARIQDHESHILGIVNNYSRMSFNFGPTLLSWMEQFAPDVYRAIQDADRDSMQHFGGHGSALAQVYNHMIMPLANTRDKETQVKWGIRDFEYRFGRKPEGMWLAETAVDTESLEVLAAHGIKFTILAPGQAKRVRPKAANGHEVPDVGWEDVNGARVDPARAYEFQLPSGRTIALFFYDGPISQAVAFEGLLKRGETLASRLLSGLSDTRDYPQMLHIATDGETYGHHHKFGDMALGYALHTIEAHNLAKLTVYGQYLEKHPPTWQAEIHESSSWSCAHGVERWRNNCGCAIGGRDGWTQLWRGPLRQALDWLRDEMIAPFEQDAAKLFRDPWGARNAYIEVLLNRTDETTREFLSSQCRKALSPEETIRALKLMELQRQAMLMYTSCGWFFDELSGIETVQIIQYAARAIQLAEELFGIKLEDGFRDRLELAKSNLEEHSDGKRIYDKFVKPGMVDLIRVGAHYAVSSLFHAQGDSARIYAFDVEREDVHFLEVGHAQFTAGKARVTSVVTRESVSITYAVLLFGEHNLTAGVRGNIPEENYQAFLKQATEAFQKSDIPEMIRLLDKHFYGLTFSLATLFKDEQRKIVNEILKGTLDQANAALRVLFEQYAPLMNFLTTLSLPQPEVLRAAGRFVLGNELRDAIEKGIPDAARVRALLADARAWHLALEAEGIEIALSAAITRKAEDLLERPSDIEVIEALSTLAQVARSMPFTVNLWRAQNVYYEILKGFYRVAITRLKTGDPGPEQWVKAFRELGKWLKVKVEE